MLFMYGSRVNSGMSIKVDVESVFLHVECQTHAVAAVSSEQVANQEHQSRAYHIELSQAGQLEDLSR